MLGSVDVWSWIHAAFPRGTCITREVPGWFQPDWALYLIWCTTRQVFMTMWMMPENTCSRRKGACWRLSHPVRLLLEHTKRATLQAIIWKEALIPQPEIPDPASCCWEVVDGTYSPVWTSLPYESKICPKLVKCGCKKGCRGRCSCATAGLPCTALCFCDGKCQHDWKSKFMNQLPCVSKSLWTRRIQRADGRTQTEGRSQKQ